MERERIQEREPEAKEADVYENVLRRNAELRQRARETPVVYRGREIGWQQGRQGLLKFYLSQGKDGTASMPFSVFIHEIRTHSGKHRHQGGLVIYVLEGHGYTLVDDARIDWEEGDLILLPIKPEGVLHQHFNLGRDGFCRWLACVYRPFGSAMGNLFEQKEDSPDWTARKT
jgi:quercetin dioxygenase-like cupin family protein